METRMWSPTLGCLLYKRRQYYDALALMVLRRITRKPVLVLVPFIYQDHSMGPVSNGLSVVDDNPGMRALIRNFVESSGYKVCAEAGSGVEAVERAKEIEPDLILLDLSMPGMNGAEAASVLKRMMPRVPIILFTMYEFGDTIAKAIGVDVVLSKPEGVQQLGAHLKELLGPASVLPKISAFAPNVAPGTRYLSPVDESPRENTKLKE
jgi:CheY-like chemotaxis protein